jgi:hypothetical protein
MALVTTYLDLLERIQKNTDRAILLRLNSARKNKPHQV